MSSNYEWQRHQANERVQARLQEAAERRKAKVANGRADQLLTLKIVIPTLIGLGLVTWLLTAI